MQLVSETSPEQVAWRAFDKAAIELQAMFTAAEGEPELAAATAGERYAKGVEVLRLWDEWRALFAAGDDPRPAA